MATETTDTECNNEEDGEGRITFYGGGGVQLTPQNHSHNPSTRRSCTLCNNCNERESSPPPSHPSIDKDKHQIHAPPSPDRTVAETVESSNWSLEDGVIGRQSRAEEAYFGEYNYHHTLNRTIAPLTFWNAKCFFNPYDIIVSCLECFGIGGRQKRRIPSQGGELTNSFHRNDCFVRVDYSSSTDDTAKSRLLESDYSWNDSYYYPYTPMHQTSGSDSKMLMGDEEEKKEEAELKPRELQQQTQYKHPPTMINKLARSLSCRMTYPPPQLRQVSNVDQKLTPISEHTRSSKYDAFSSLNTLHRRNDHYSVSFFTSDTLDAIHTSSPSNATSLTPRDNQSGTSPRGNPLEYKTPPNRGRADSDTFRRTIQVVTCEKRVRDDVSPIPMDTPRFDKITPRRHEQQSAGEQTASNKTMHRVNLFGEEVFMVDSNDHHSASTTKDQCAKEEEEVAATDDDDDAALLWPETYLQKSPSYIKALRKAGRKGKCLIQGWVAFRQSVSWVEIIQSPRRCDFQYVVLLDDMPLLHIFPSSPKAKRTQPKARKNVLDDCITFDLSNNVGIEVQLASQELGNEIRIVDTETGAFYGSMLPISMPDDVFQDKHKSRLAKSDVLSNVFASSYHQQDMSSLPSSFDEYEEKTDIDQSQYSKKIFAPPEQYDVSRHLMFVLDAAIQFPLPRNY